MKTLLLLSLLLTQTSLAQELPRVLLGRGISTHDKGLSEEKWAKQWKRISKGTSLEGETPLRKSFPERNLFIGFECIGGEDRAGCATIQGVEIDLDKMVVIARGEVINVVSSADAISVERPSKEVLKHFLKNYQQTYKRHRLNNLSNKEEFTSDVIAWTGGIAAMGSIAILASAGTAVPIIIAIHGVNFVILNYFNNVNLKLIRNFHITDTRGWNWSSEPKHVSYRTYSAFRSFVFQKPTTNSTEITQNQDQE